MKQRKAIYKPKTTVRQFVINDAYNSLKQHIFRVYNDYHISYNQAINGLLFYPSFERANKKHGYYEYLLKVKQK